MGNERQGMGRTKGDGLRKDTNPHSLERVANNYIENMNTETTLNEAWEAIVADARKWRKANPDIARVINPNNQYKRL